MKKVIKEHIDFIENILQKENVNFDWCALSDFNKTQIKFFQHERLIHLLVTLFFGLMFFGSIAIELLLNICSNSMFFSVSFSVISAILLVTLIFYILHYFFLENNIQKLYQLEKEIMKRCHGDYIGK